MRELNLTEAELEAVAGGDDRKDKGGVGGVAGLTGDEVEAVAGGDDRKDKGGVGGVAG